MLPCLRENGLHRRHQTRLRESEGNFSIIRNTFDRQVGEGMNRETAVDIYTALTLHVKSTSKDRVNSAGESTQCSVVKMGRKSKREGDTYIDRYMTDSLCCTAEIDTAV